MPARRAVPLLAVLLLLLPAAARTAAAAAHGATRFANPILPGFHPDPSCIHVPDDDGNGDSPGTFYCASSSFSAFPGIPLHASRDLQHWSLVGHVLNRRSQLPALADTNRSTSGLWAPTLRYHGGTFYVVTTLVHDERPQTDVARWDNLIFRAGDLRDPASWSDPTRFRFTGYDPSPFWDDDGRSYIVASHAWQLRPGIQLAAVDLDTGAVDEGAVDEGAVDAGAGAGAGTGGWATIWTGTGGLAPEGPHLYRQDGYYYLLIAEGGTGLGHRATMARSPALWGPYTPHPDNPVLTNANTSCYFQTVGHADLFPDAAGHWWAAALATRSGPAYINYPMGRETVLTPVQWQTGADAAVAGWPHFAPVRGTMHGPLPAVDHAQQLQEQQPQEQQPQEQQQQQQQVGDDLDFAAWPPGRALPAYFTYWRPPVAGAYAVVPVPAALGGGSRALRLRPSALNLTGLDGNTAGPGGQTFVGRRQAHTLFLFRVDVTFGSGTAAAAATAAAGEDEAEDEAGVSVFLTQNHHLDLGLVRAAGGTFLRFRGITSGAAAAAQLPPPTSVAIPASWSRVDGTDAAPAPLRVTLQIMAANATHYTFAAWPTRAESQMRTVAWANNDAVSWGFTGALLGVYCTSNGRAGGGVDGPAPVYVHRWQYTPLDQFRD